VQIELALSNNRQRVIGMLRVSHPSSMWECLPSGRVRTIIPSLLILKLHLRTGISGITTMAETQRTGGEDIDQRRHDNREIRFELGSHCFANHCPCGVELLA